ncbi:helix-turn-helix domain-containing protein [Pseudonocardia lacus]|uniref:helix-turn-helix domain-containing protein n=1 Tax=Pseudonocardia lacus TaxID=2835865 RepID=UPI001BDC812C|nr:helix-turn-helix transcriptional regulator [Pseudonocardia lacus]
MSSPVAMRLQLRVELKRLRVEAGLTQKYVADRLDWSPSKVIRIENGQVAVAVSDLRALTAIYGQRDEQVLATLERLARGSKRLPFTEYRDILTSDTINFFGYEGSAAVIRQVNPAVVPGILQAEEYARSVLGLRDRTPAEIDRMVQTRRDRQEILESDRPLLHFILDESVLRRQVGGPSVMRSQLSWILELVDSGRISVQVLPFELGYHECLRGSFVHLEFGSASESDILFMENAWGGRPQFFEDLETTGSYKEIFYGLENKALDAIASTALIRGIQEFLETVTESGATG